LPCRIIGVAATGQRCEAVPRDSPESDAHSVSEVKVVKNRHALAIDAEREREEEQEALGKIDHSRYVYKFRLFDSKGYTINALAASHLWCSHFQSFNDIFEFRFDYDRHPAKTDEMFELWQREFPQYSNMSREMVVELHIRHCGVGAR
jgi:hypothetical protein